MKKSELQKIIREEIQRINESVELKVGSLSWATISKYTDRDGMVWLPDTFDATLGVGSESRFSEWKSRFIKRWGNAIITQWKPSSFSVKERSNSKWDTYYKSGSSSVRSTYGNKKYTGD
jgi:hypothetical protein